MHRFPDDVNEYRNFTVSKSEKSTHVHLKPPKSTGLHIQLISIFSSELEPSHHMEQKIYTHVGDRTIESGSSWYSLHEPMEMDTTLAAKAFDAAMSKTRQDLWHRAANTGSRRGNI